MSGYNFGHASLFWNEIIYALDTLEDIPEERRVVSLISPWIRDLSLTASNLSSDDWADLFDMPGRLFANLSDVLVALAEIGFTVTVLTLDAEDKALSKQNTPGLLKEETFVRKLTLKHRDNLKVLKKFGIHNKLFCFPYSVLMGSVNMTHRGMLGNSESLSKISFENDKEGFLKQLTNAHALLDGSVDYALGSVVRFEPPSMKIFGIEGPDEGYEDYFVDSDFVQLPPGFLKEFRELLEKYDMVDDRLFKVGLEPSIEAVNERKFLNPFEVFFIYTELCAFEKEFRYFVLNYYKQYANMVAAWKDFEIKPLAQNWHKLVHVNGRKEPISMHDKAKNTVRQRKLVSSDISSGIIPDLDNLSPDEAIVIGSTLGDLRSVLIGNPSSRPLKLIDLNKSDLFELALGMFTGRLTGKDLTRKETAEFWSKLLAGGDTPYTDIQWARNALAHPNEISLERAIKAKEGMRHIRRTIFDPWERLYPGDTEP
jgi:hypothetical protein